VIGPGEPPLRGDDFFDRVYALVARIPVGRVTTYGHLAEHLGTRRGARAVGWALNKAAGTDLPCHRVVNRRGALTGARHFESPTAMEERLRSEGVAFNEQGEVDLDRHLWTPAEAG
jgi:methylated-DNA-protein-cysteine methyltransferase related protein